MRELFNLDNDIFLSDKIKRLKSEEKEKEFRIKKYNKFYRKCDYTDLIDCNESINCFIDKQNIICNLSKEKDKLLYCVYVIKYIDNIIYVGATSNLKNRIKSHIKSIKRPYNNNLKT